MDSVREAWTSLTIYQAIIALLVFSVVLSLFLVKSDMLSGLFQNSSHQSFLGDFPEHLSEKNSSSPVDLESNSSAIQTKNLYKFRKEDSVHLDKDSYVLVPYEGEDAGVKIGTAMPDAKTIKAGVEAKNAALLTQKPVKWVDIDCGKSEIIIRARTHKTDNRDSREIIQDRAVVDNRAETIEINTTRMRGQNATLSVSLGDPTGCGSKSNKAALLEDLYLTWEKTG